MTPLRLGLTLIRGPQRPPGVLRGLYSLLIVVPMLAWQVAKLEPSKNQPLRFHWVPPLRPRGRQLRWLRGWSQSCLTPFAFFAQTRHPHRTRPTNWCWECLWEAPLKVLLTNFASPLRLQEASMQMVAGEELEAAREEVDPRHSLN